MSIKCYWNMEPRLENARRVTMFVKQWMVLCPLLNVSSPSPMKDIPTVDVTRMTQRRSGAAPGRMRWADTPRASGEFVPMSVPLNKAYFNIQ